MKYNGKSVIDLSRQSNEVSRPYFDFVMCVLIRQSSFSSLLRISLDIRENVDAINTNTNTLHSEYNTYNKCSRALKSLFL